MNEALPGPADPRIRAFLDALAECVADAVLRELVLEANTGERAEQEASLNTAGGSL